MHKLYTEHSRMLCANIKSMEFDAKASFNQPNGSTKQSPVVVPTQPRPRKYVIRLRDSHNNEEAGFMVHRKQLRERYRDPHKEYKSRSSVYVRGPRRSALANDILPWEIDEEWGKPYDL